MLLGKSRSPQWFAMAEMREPFVLERIAGVTQSGSGGDAALVAIQI